MTRTLLFDVDQTAAMLAELQPAVVVNCAVLQTWHVIRRLPEDVYVKLSSAGLGAWLPVQLTLAMKLAQALQLSGISAHYVNTSLSDLTNPVLGAMGMLEGPLAITTVILPSVLLALGCAYSVHLLSAGSGVSANTTRGTATDGASSEGV